jgi:hypothetical protein
MSQPPLQTNEIDFDALCESIKSFKKSIVLAKDCL